MKRWRYTDYARPYLALDKLRFDADASALELVQGESSFQLSAEVPAALEREILPLLEALRDPRSEVWREARTADSELSSLLQELDHLGFLRDAAEPSREPRAAATWSARVEHWVDEVLRGARDAAAMERLGACAAQLHAALQPTADDGALAALLGERNFYALTLRLQARHLRRAAPASWWLYACGLERVAQGARGTTSSSRAAQPPPSFVVEADGSALHDRVDVGSTLDALGALLRWSAAPNAERRAPPALPDPARAPTAGINVALDAEAHARRVARALGDHPLILALNELRARGEREAARDVMRAAFVQEYLVTQRFPGCIAQVLGHAFPAALRRKLERYMVEEIGHEEYEFRNCRRLGLSAEQIRAAAPLPLHRAFVDVLCELGHAFPMGFFLASLVTEGPIGSDVTLPSLAEELWPDCSMAKELGKHAAVNDAADHRAIGREWMREIDAVAREPRQHALEFVGYLVELNWRMWADLVAATPTLPE